MKLVVSSDWSGNMYLHKLSLKLCFNNGSFQLTKGVRKSIKTFPRNRLYPATMVIATLHVGTRS